MEFSDSEFEDMMDFTDLDPRSTAIAVAQQCLAQGYESLTPRQKAIYDRYVRPGAAPPDAPPKS